MDDFTKWGVESIAKHVEPSTFEKCAEAFRKLKDQQILDKFRNLDETS